GGHGGHGDDHGNEPHGRINSLPQTEGLIGTWVISGTSYVVTTTTRLDPRYGPFRLNACVQVKSDRSTTPATAIWIRTKQDFVCASDDDHDGDGHGGPGVAHGVLFGVIESFPISLTGTWEIGSMNFEADHTTEFDQKHGPFAISTTVEVKFYID